MPENLDAEQSRFDAVARSVQDALIAADAASRIVFWSPSAERVFGWSEAEALGEPLTILMPRRFHHPHHAGISRLTAGGEPRIVGGPPVELVAVRRDCTEFPIELTLGRWTEDGRAFFTGVIRDISARRRDECVLATQYEVAAALAASQDLDEGIARALEVVGVGMGWQAVQLWLIDEESQRLCCRSAWSGEGSVLEDFVGASAGRTFARGEGLPGRAWATRKAVCLERLEQAEGFPRRREAAAAGLRTGVAVPLLADDVDRGVLELFGAVEAAPDAATLDSVEALARQLAQFLLRREAEAQLQRRHEHARQAAELNDEVVQGLVVAGYLLAGGQIDSAKDALDTTLDAARAIVDDLLGERSPEPGDLRRAAPATKRPLQR